MVNRKDVVRGVSGLLVASTIAGCATPVVNPVEPTKVESPTPGVNYNSLRVVGENALNVQDLAEKEKIKKVCEAMNPGVDIFKTVGWNVVDEKGREIDLWVCEAEKNGLENIFFAGFHDPKANKLYGNNPMKEIGHYVSGDHKTEQMVAFYRDKDNKIDQNSLTVLASLDTRQGSAMTRQALTMTVIGEDGKGKEVEVANVQLGSFDLAIHTFGTYLDGLNKVDVVKAEAPTETPVAVETKQPTPPVVEATATVEAPKIDEAKVEAIAANVKDYLNSTGNFTQAEVRKNMFTMNWIKDRNYPQMGIFSADNNKTQLYVAGLNLGVLNVGDVKVIIVGTQDVNGKRIVQPVQYLPEGYNNDNFTTGIFEPSTNDIPTFQGTQQLIKTEAQFEEIMKSDLGKAVAVNLLIVPEVDFRNSYGMPMNKDLTDYYSKMDAHLQANLNFMRSVWRDTRYSVKPGMPFYSINQIIDSMGGNQTPNTVVKTAEDLRNLKNILSQLPITDNLGAVK